MAHRLQHKPTHLNIKLLFLGPLELYIFSTWRTFYYLRLKTHVFVSNTHAFLSCCILVRGYSYTFNWVYFSIISSGTPQPGIDGKT